MNENDSFVLNDKYYMNESINLPSLSFFTTFKSKNKKINSFNELNDKEIYDLSIPIKTKNNENINDTLEPQVTGPDIEFTNQNILNNNKNQAIFRISLEKKEKKGKKEKKEKKEKKQLKNLIQYGRKKKNSSEEGKHNKYAGDNIIRKCKRILLHYLYVLINNIIDEKYKNGNFHKIKNKRLVKINQYQIINLDCQFNKDFLHKTLKDIFSENITTRCTKYNLDHNKNLINNLLNEEDNDKKELFTKIFNLTFLDCLEHFRGTKFIKELENLVKYEDICKKFEDDEDYLYSFKYYIENYEKIILNKNSRKKRKE
jgi:hypothetical protein